MKSEVLENWLVNVALDHSGSKYTEAYYRRDMTGFCEFKGISPEEILEDRKKIKSYMDENEFKRKYAVYLKEWKVYLFRKGYTQGTIRTMLGVPKAFFRDHNLPLDRVSLPMKFHPYHNRDITRVEIAHILSMCSPRDRAIFSILAQSGLRPETLCNLKLKHIEPEFPIPCKITIPQDIAKGKYHGYFTFIGYESVAHLKNYLKDRAELTPENYLFTKQGTEEKVSRTSISVIFRNKLLRLKRKGLVQFEQKQKGKPSELRLYSLRKWFRKQAGNAGSDFAKFWMGHTLGVDEHYFSRDPEHHKKIYKEKATPFLRLEKSTPSETDKILGEQNKRIEKLEGDLEEIKQTASRQERHIKYLTEKIGGQEKLDKIIIEDISKQILEEYMIELGVDRQKIKDFTCKELEEVLEKAKKLRRKREHTRDAKELKPAYEMAKAKRKKGET